MLHHSIWPEAALTMKQLDLAILLGVLATAAGCQPSPDPLYAAYRGGMVEPPIPKVDFTLTSHANEPYHFVRETDGFTTLLFFGYTYCPDICPIHMSRIATAMRGLPEAVTSQVKVVFVTVDPDRDTPERLHEWLTNFHPSFIGLTGDTGEIAQIMRSLRLRPGIVEKTDDEYLVSHPASIIGFTPDNAGRFLYATNTRVEDWAHDLALIGDGDWSNVTELSDRSGR